MTIIVLYITSKPNKINHVYGETFTRRGCKTVTSSWCFYMSVCSVLWFVETRQEAAVEELSGIRESSCMCGVLRQKGIFSGEKSGLESNPVF